MEHKSGFGINRSIDKKFSMLFGKRTHGMLILFQAIILLCGLMYLKKMNQFIFSLND